MPRNGREAGRAGADNQGRGSADRDVPCHRAPLSCHPLPLLTAIGHRGEFVKSGGRFAAADSTFISGVNVAVLAFRAQGV